MGHTPKHTANPLYASAGNRFPELTANPLYANSFSALAPDSAYTCSHGVPPARALQLDGAAGWYESTDDDQLDYKPIVFSSNGEALSQNRIYV